MSKGSTRSQYGCNTFGALVTEAQQKEEEESGIKPMRNVEKGDFHDYVRGNQPYATHFY